MGKSWRKIVVDGTEYRWRGTCFVVVQDVNGKRILCEPMHKIKGVSSDTFERGRWKKTSDGRLYPSELSKFISENNERSGEN